MADTTFGDSSLFDVFEPVDEPSDRLLLAKFRDEFPEREESRNLSEKSGPVHIRFCSSSDSSDDELSERESGKAVPVDRPKPSDTGFVRSTNVVDRSAISLDSDSVLRGPSLNRASEYSISTSNSHGHYSLNGVPDDHYSQQKLEQLNEDIARLQYENAILKRHSRIINPEKLFTDQEGPALQVVFMNHYFSRKYKSDIEDFVGKLIEKEQKKRYNDMPPLEDLHSSVCIASQSDRPAYPDEKIRNSRSSTVIGCCQFYREFAVDAMGWPLIKRNPSLTDGWEIPNYEQIYKMPLPFVEEEEEDGPPKREKRAKPTCFNCGGDHMISECKEAKDHRKINQAKREFMDRCSSGQPMRSTRYHVDGEMKYGNKKPGVLSAEARNALGISDFQLPPYIYQMRKLGYPPGWLEEARIVKHSRMSMFGKDGQVESDDAQALEDGELDLESIPDNNQFDTSKVIEYPGFNVDPPRGVIDEYEELGMQPMLPHQSKEALVLFLSPRGTNVTKRQLSGGNKPAIPKRQKVQHSLVDMDVESQGPGARRGSASQSSSTRTSRSTTPTLEELEEQKLLLQTQLARAEGGNTPVEVDILDSCDDSQEDEKLSSEDDAARSRPGLGMRRVSSQASIESSPQGSPFRIPFPVGSTTPATPASDSSWCPPLPAETPPATPPPPIGTPPTTPRSDRPVSGSALSETPGSSLGFTPQTASSRLASTSFSSMMSTPQSSNSLLRTPSSGGSISVAFGTPIDKENSGKKDGLPSSSQFAEGICEHIPFANLPNSTGTFERMRRVLACLRAKTK